MSISNGYFDQLGGTWAIALHCQCNGLGETDISICFLKSSLCLLIKMQRNFQNRKGSLLLFLGSSYQYLALVSQPRGAGVSWAEPDLGRQPWKRAEKGSYKMGWLCVGVLVSLGKHRVSSPPFSGPSSGPCFALLPAQG